MKKDDVKIGAALAAAIMNDPQTMKIPWYRKMFKRRSGVRPLSRNKYSNPHQGEQEMARRRRQIERGIIRP